MPPKNRPIKRTQQTKAAVESSSKPAETLTTKTGDIKESTGVAIGTNAKAIVIQIRSLFDFENFSRFTRRHWIFLSLNAVALGLAYLLWNYFKDRFLIPSSTLFIGLAILEIGLVLSYLFITSTVLKWFALVLGVAVWSGLLGMIVSQYNRAIHPKQFAADRFGIAIANFGEGSNFRKTVLAGEISESVFRRLRQQIDENQELRDFVDIKQIGVIRTREEAIEEGQRFGADLVIWGQLQSNEEVTSISFEVLESDYVSNPNFPRIIPLLKYSISDTLFIPGKSSEEIAEATTTISGFVFGLAHLFKWDFQPSQNAFREAIASSQLHSESDLYLLYFYYGLSLQWDGDLETAEKQFVLASKIRPEDPAAYLAMAYGNRSLGNRELALSQAQQAYELINQYIRQQPDEVYAFYDRALANLILEERELALRDYQTAIQIEPDFYIARVGLISAYIETERLPEAIQAAEEAIILAEEKEISPEWAYLLLANAYALNDQPDLARLNFERATTDGSHIDWIHYLAGQFYFENGDYELALQEFQSMLKVTGNKAWGYSTLAKFYAEIGVLDEAVINYQEALQYNPEDDGIWVALADVYADLERIAEAENAYGRGISLAERPGNLIYDLTLYGNFLYRQERYEEAIDQWVNALALDPEHCDLMLNLGLAYERTGQTAEARNNYINAQSVGRTTNPQCASEAELRLGNLSP